MTLILGIDPGPEQSAYVIYDTTTKGIIIPGIIDTETVENFDLLDVVTASTYDEAWVEMIASYGMPVGQEVFETCVMIGKILLSIEARIGKAHVHRVFRREAKMNLCHDSKASDANVRQAIIDRFGGKAAIGTKKAPGPLYGVKADIWAALAVALYGADQEGGA